MTNAELQTRIDALEELLVHVASMTWSHSKGLFDGTNPASRNRLVELLAEVRPSGPSQA